MAKATDERYRSYTEFFPFYLSQHSNAKCRFMHYIGSTIGLLALGMMFYTTNPAWILVGLIGGYACAWIGHFFIEKNRPATFTYPLWSFIGDYHMFVLMLTGKLKARI